MEPRPPPIRSTPIRADQVLALCLRGEGLRVEFKRGLPSDAKIARVLAGFANARGGTLLVGVEDRGRRIGVADPQGTAAELRRVAATRVRPPVALQVDTLELEGVRLVVARVRRREGPPHAALDGHDRAAVVQRRGSKTRAASVAAIAQLRADRGAADLPEDERAALAWLRTSAGAPDVERLAAALGLGRSRARRLVERLARAGWLLPGETPDESAD